MARIIKMLGQTFEDLGYYPPHRLMINMALNKTPNIPTSHFFIYNSRKGHNLYNLAPDLICYHIDKHRIESYFSRYFRCAFSSSLYVLFCVCHMCTCVHAYVQNIIPLVSEARMQQVKQEFLCQAHISLRQVIHRFCVTCTNKYVSSILLLISVTPSFSGSFWLIDQ